MEVSFNGFHQQTATFIGDVEIGDLVTLSGSGSVKPAAEDDDLIGVCVSKCGNAVGVQLCGAVTLTYTGTAPSVGRTVLAAAGSNQVKIAETGEKHLVVCVNTDQKTCTVIL